MTFKQTKLATDTSTQTELDTEIRRLREGIAHTQVAIGSSQIKLSGLEHKIAVFLEKYYQEVGGLFEQWRRLNSKTQCTQSANNNEPEITATNTTKAPPSHEKGLKKLYRKLAKAYHPDKSGADKLFKHIHIAFKEKNLGELIRLEQELMDAQDFANETAFEKMLRLSDSYDEAVQELGDLHARIHTLENSKAYALRHRVISANIRGYDVIGELKQDLRQKIAARHKELVA